MFVISEEFKKKLAKEGIDTDDVIEFITENDKNKKIIITKITLANGTKYELTDNFIWYAARKDKRW